MEFLRIERRTRRGRHWGPTLYCERCRRHAPHLLVYEAIEVPATKLCPRCADWIIQRPYRDAELRAIRREIP